MAFIKRVLCPQKLRRVPQQFSWIDHRLVRDRHIAGKSAEALALYLFLVTVADGQGLSYYSDAGIGKLLPLDGLALARARQRLAGFVADPARHLQHAAKVLLKFKLLELQSVSLRDLLAWAEATTYVAKLVARQYAGHTLAEAVDVLVQDLVRAGAARLGGTQLHNA